MKTWSSLLGEKTFLVNKCRARKVCIFEGIILPLLLVVKPTTSQPLHSANYLFLLHPLDYFIQWSPTTLQHAVGLLARSLTRYAPETSALVE